MPTIKVELDGRLQNKFYTGVDDAGKPIYKTKSFKGVKPEATDEDLMAVSQAISGLQQNTLSTVLRIDESELLNG